MKLNKIWPYVLGISILAGIAFTTKQMIGPSSPTTKNAIVRWRSTDAFSTTNSSVTIDDFNNLSGVNTQQVTEADINIITVSNIFLYLQKSSAPTAGQIGGTVGSLTNIAVMNLNGALMKYWSDGTTLYSQEIGSH